MPVAGRQLSVDHPHLALVAAQAGMRLVLSPLLVAGWAAVLVVAVPRAQVAQKMHRTRACRHVGKPNGRGVTVGLQELNGSSRSDPHPHLPRCI